MKIAIVAPSPVPFVIGGAENLWWGLLDALNARPGIQADLVKLPSPERNMGELLSSYRRFSELDLSHFDVVISTKYPAWAIRHPNHIVYLQHTLRGLYDCYPPDMPTHVDPDVLLALRMPTHIVDALVKGRADGVEFDEVMDALDAAFARAPQSPCWAFPGPVTRAVIHLLDGVAMRPDRIAHYAAISQVVAAREGYFPAGVDVAVHHHPTNLKGLAAGPQQTIFSASRLDPAKRIELIIEGYIQSRVDVPLHIAGGGPDEARLRAAAGNHPGIRFLGRIPDAELAQEYAKAICVPFVPRDEDYGLITLEAMLCAKPVIATTDSGGPIELIDDDRTGLIIKPDAQSMAAAMRRLVGDLPASQQMGVAAQARANQLSWDALCEALLSGSRPLRVQGHASRESHTTPVQAAHASAPAVITRRAKPLLGVLNTFPIAPVVSGGKLRLHGLYSRVAEQFDVQFINLVSHGAREEVRVLGTGFSERLVPKSRALFDEEMRLQETLGTSVEDLAAAMYPSTAPQWLDAIDTLAREAEMMVCSHPYAMPALLEVSQAPFVYEAHNVEADLKADIYSGHSWAAERVSALERHAVREAALVTACSAPDLERLSLLYGRERDDSMIIVPNGADMSGTPFRDAARKAERRAKLGVTHPLALFMGSAHGPNIDAARVVFEAAARLPQVQFLLLGSVCSVVDTWARPANIGLAGVVSDVEKSSWLDLCDVGLNPVISGSGTNLKLIEYAAAGVPIVSTEFGARGVGLSAGTEYVSASGDAFAQGIETLLAKSHVEREAMARLARRRLEVEADWTTIAGVFTRALTQLIQVPA